MTTHFHVAPRYTPGSPAQVDEATAVRVLHQEREASAAWRRALKGDTGPANLDAVVYSTMQMYGHVHVLDEMTGARYRVPEKHWPPRDSDGRLYSWHEYPHRERWREPTER